MNLNSAGTYAPQKLEHANTAHVRQVYGGLLEQLERRKSERAALGLPFHEMPEKFSSPTSGHPEPPPQLRRTSSDSSLLISALAVTHEQVNDTNTTSPLTTEAPAAGLNPTLNRVRGALHQVMADHRRRAADMLRCKRQFEEASAPTFAEADVRSDYSVNQALFIASSNYGEIEAFTEDAELSIQALLAEHDPNGDYDGVYEDLGEVPPTMEDTRPTSITATLRLERVMADMAHHVVEKVGEIENFFTLLYVGLVHSGLALDDGEEYLRRQSILKNTAMLAIIDLVIPHVASATADALRSLRAEIVPLVGGYTWERFVKEYGGLTVVSKKKAQTSRARHLAEIRTALVGDKVLDQLKRRLVSLREESERVLKETVASYESRIKKESLDFEQRRREMTEEIKVLRSRVEDLSSTQSDAQRDASHLRDALEKSTRNLLELREYVNQAGPKHQKQLEDLCRDHEEAKAKLKDEIRVMNKTIDELLLSKNDFLERIEGLQNDVENGFQWGVKLERENNQHLTTISELRDRKTQLEAEVQDGLNTMQALILQNQAEQEAMRNSYEALLAEERALIAVQKEQLAEKENKISALTADVQDLHQTRKDLQGMRVLHYRLEAEITEMKLLHERLKAGMDRQRRSTRRALVNNFLLRVAAIRKPDLVAELQHRLDVTKDQQRWIEDTLTTSTKKLVESRAEVEKLKKHRAMLRTQQARMEEAAMNFHELLSSSRYVESVVVRTTGTQYHEKSFVGLYHELEPPYSEISVDEPTPTHMMHMNSSSSPHGILPGGIAPFRYPPPRPLSAPLEKQSVGEIPSGLTVEGLSGPSFSVIDASPYDYFGKMRRKKIAETNISNRKGHIAVSGTGTVCKRLPPSYSNPAGAWRRNAATH